MIRADQLVVVGGVEDAAGVSALLPPFVRLEDDAGRQLIVEIVEMDNIWSKIVQHQPQFLPGLGRINGLERVCKLRQLAAAVEIHAAGVGIHPVAHTASLMLHPEILHLMAHPFQLLSQLEHIGLRAAVGVEEFVYHQDLHLVRSSLLYTDVEIFLHIFFFSLFVPLLLAAFLHHGQWFSLGIASSLFSEISRHHTIIAIRYRTLMG